MPTTTWAVARDEIARPLGFKAFATTTNVAGSSTAVISTELADDFPNDDYFNGWYFILEQDSDGSTPANGLGLIRRVTDYAASTGTLTLAGANLSSEDEAVDCALHRFHPDAIKIAYNRVRQIVYPQIAMVRDIETLVTGSRQVAYTIPTTMRRIRRIDLGQRYEAGSLAENLFDNGDFEDWSTSTSADNWTIAGSGASINRVEQTSSPSDYAVLSGSNSARIVVASSTVTTLLQTVTPSVTTEGMELNISAWVYCKTASRVSTQIATVNGTGLGLHSGSGWERLSQSADLAATATNFAAGLSITSGAAIPVVVDEIIGYLGPSELVEKPYYPLTRWTQMPAVGGADNEGIIRFHEHPPEKHRLRIQGVDLLSSVSADSDTIEIQGNLLEPLYNKVRAELCNERVIQATGSTARDRWAERRNLFEVQYREAIGADVHLHMPLRRVPGVEAIA